MSNGFLSQEEIDALLNGGVDSSSKDDKTPDDAKGKELEGINADKGEQAPETDSIAAGAVSEDMQQLSEVEKDLLGEVGNISMGSAATALSTIINQKVNITTPVVTVTTGVVIFTF